MKNLYGRTSHFGTSIHTEDNLERFGPKSKAICMLEIGDENWARLFVNAPQLVRRYKKMAREMHHLQRHLGQFDDCPTCSDIRGFIYDCEVEDSEVAQ